MIGWILCGIILYFIIGFIYALTMLLIIISEDSEDEIKELDSGGERLMIILVCTMFWIILFPTSMIYRLYRKIKGGN